MNHEKRRNPYLQVALTYVHRPLSSWYAACMGYVVVTACIEGLARSRHGTQLIVGLGLSGLVVGTWSCQHLTQLLFASNAMVIPGLRRVNATVAAGVALVLAVLAPILIAILAGLDAVGCAAYTAIIFAIGFYLARCKIGWMLFILGAAAFFGYLLEGRLVQVVQGHSPGLAAALTVLAFVLYAATLARLTLARPRGNRPQRRAQLQNKHTPACQLTSPPTNEMSATAASRPSCAHELQNKGTPRNLANHWERNRDRNTSAGLPKVLRWRSGPQSPRSQRIISMVAMLPIVMVFPQIGKLHHETWKVVWPMIVGLAMFLAAVRPLSLWRIRARSLSIDLMRPVERSALFRQLGALLALDYLAFWLVAAFACLVIIPVLAHAGVGLRFRLILAVAEFGVQWLIFGAGVLVLSYRAGSRHSVGLVVYMIFSFLLSQTVAYVCMTYASVELALGIAVALAFFGLLIARYAYQRWLSTELG